MATKTKKKMADQISLPKGFPKDIANSASFKKLSPQQQEQIAHHWNSVGQAMTPTGGPGELSNLARGVGIMGKEGVLPAAGQALHGMLSDVLDPWGKLLTGKSGGQAKPKGGGAAAAPTATDPFSAQSMISPSIMPLFMQQVMQPYMNSILSQIHQTSQGYGDYMGKMMGLGPGSVHLDPGIRQALQAMVPGQQASMNLMGQSAIGNAVGGSVLDQLNAAIQQGTAAQRTAQGEYEKQLGALYAPSLSGTGAMTPGALGGSVGIPGLTAPTMGGAAGITGYGAPSMSSQLKTNAIANAGG